MEVDRSCTLFVVVELGAGDEKKKLEDFRGARPVSETPLHLSENIVEGVGEVACRCRRFVRYVIELMSTHSDG